MKHQQKRDNKSRRGVISDGISINQRMVAWRGVSMKMTRQ